MLEFLSMKEFIKQPSDFPKEMPRLTKGVYGHEFDHIQEGPFGLRTGQTRFGIGKITHNSGWYNKLGEKLGFGDLSSGDFERIKAELQEMELFIILNEHDSFRNFVIRNGVIGGMAAVDQSVEAPGIDYVAELCRYIIAKGRVYAVSGNRYLDKLYKMDNGLKVRRLHREEAQRFIKHE